MLSMLINSCGIGTNLGGSIIPEELKALIFKGIFSVMKNIGLYSSGEENLIYLGIFMLLFAVFVTIFAALVIYLFKKIKLHFRIKKG